MPKRRVPVTLIIGVLLITLCEAVLAIDAERRDICVLKSENDVAALPEPEDTLEHIARFVAVDMTPLCWVGYLLVMDGLLALLHRRRPAVHADSPVRSRSRRFAVAFITSVLVWLFFDWVNFHYIHAWDYLGLPASRAHEYIAKFIAFGAISPAMFLAAELFQTLGVRKITGRPIPISRSWQVAVFALGIPMLIFPFVIRQPIGCLTLWLAVIFVLDPINHFFGTPSLIDDWGHGRFARTISLMAGGLTCGFLWEFWNYWAVAKWVYDLPFLGPFEAYRLFEMPLPGFAGFPPFALECSVAFQTILLVLRALSARFIEPLPDYNAVL